MWKREASIAHTLRMDLWQWSKKHLMSSWKTSEINKICVFIDSGFSYWDRSGWVFKKHIRCTSLFQADYLRTLCLITCLEGNHVSSESYWLGYFDEGEVRRPIMYSTQIKNTCCWFWNNRSHQITNTFSHLRDFMWNAFMSVTCSTVLHHKGF